MMKRSTVKAFFYRALLSWKIPQVISGSGFLQDETQPVHDKPCTQERFFSSWEEGKQNKEICNLLGHSNLSFPALSAYKPNHQVTASQNDSGWEKPPSISNNCMRA